ncbi:hypothetical protein ACTXG7_12430 [Mycolicibacterium sp. Dal123E01]|uniref:hypothetical protein n=1 Tax=Mycolicibacterium sp. Dal123E01 TaxID=3457578 RepID=UPI00403E5FF4
MELRWWPLALAGLICLIACVALALIRPLDRADLGLRPLAHVDRLTSLPEYARIRRRQMIAAATTIALLVVLFVVATLTAARPSASGREFDALHPEDVMLCLGAPVTEGTTAQFLDHFARQTATFEAQRIGLTTPTARVVPLTRDYQFAAQRLGDYPAAKTVAYANYTPTVADTLALCLTGFGTAPTTHRRSLIYLGPSTFGGNQPGLFNDQQVAEMAAKAGVQVNAIVAVDVADAAQRGDAELNALTSGSRGLFFRYHAAVPGGSDASLISDLDTIRANPAPTAAPPPDHPGPLLLTALAAAALLGLALVVVRR